MKQHPAYKAAEADRPTDEALMDRARQGDEFALAELIRRYEGPLFNYIAKMLGNRADAEDIFQETFLRVHLNGNRFWFNAPFRPWVYRIATNLCKDRLRYRKRRPEVPASSLATEDWPDPLARWEERRARPDETAQVRERADAMKQALADLSIKHRAVFLMAHQDGLSYQEIARALRIPVGTVKSRMNKAVGQLLAVMEGLD